MFWIAVRKFLQPQLCDIAIYIQLEIQLCLPCPTTLQKMGGYDGWMDGKMD